MLLCSPSGVLQATAEVLDKDGRAQAGEALAAFALRDNLRSARHQLAEQQRLTRQQSSHIGAGCVLALPALVRVALASS